MLTFVSTNFLRTVSFDHTKSVDLSL